MAMLNSTDKGRARDGVTQRRISHLSELLLTSLPYQVYTPSILAAGALGAVVFSALSAPGWIGAIAFGVASFMTTSLALTVIRRRELLELKVVSPANDESEVTVFKSEIGQTKQTGGIAISG